MELAQTSSGIVQSQIAEQFEQIDALKAENSRLEREIKLANRKMQVNSLLPFIRRKAYKEVQGTNG